MQLNPKETLMMSDTPILKDVTLTPEFPRYAIYRWCDYIELRCLTHIDGRFSRDNLEESLGENREISCEDSAEDLFDDSIDEEEDNFKEVALPTSENDAEESFASGCFKQLRWRAEAFGNQWPFVIDEHAVEIKIKESLSNSHYLYLQLLLSSLLKYAPEKQRKNYTAPFEKVCFQIFRGLMPQGATVEPFGAAVSTRYKGRIFNRLQQLAKDIRGELRLTERDFPKNSVGDAGLDLVAWHDLADKRDHIPIALAQCGCTADGWPDKMLEASPAKLGGTFITGHPWATYYFMPLDLSDEQNGNMEWQEKRHMHAAIVIDRLRLIRLADPEDLAAHNLLAKTSVDKALKLNLS